MGKGRQRRVKGTKSAHKSPHVAFSQAKARTDTKYRAPEAATSASGFAALPPPSRSHLAAMRTVWTVLPYGVNDRRANYQRPWRVFGAPALIQEPPDMAFCCCYESCPMTRLQCDRISAKLEQRYCYNKEYARPKVSLLHIVCRQPRISGTNDRTNRAILRGLGGCRQSPLVRADVCYPGRAGLCDLAVSVRRYSSCQPRWRWAVHTTCS